MYAKWTRFDCTIILKHLKYFEVHIFYLWIIKHIWFVAILEKMSFYCLENNHLSSSQHTSPATIRSQIRVIKRLFQCISICKPCDSLKLWRKLFIEHFQLILSRIIFVYKPLMQKNSHLIWSVYRSKEYLLLQIKTMWCCSSFYCIVNPPLEPIGIIIFCFILFTYSNKWLSIFKESSLVYVLNMVSILIESWLLI